jgi:hypothetical protein
VYLAGLQGLHSLLQYGISCCHGLPFFSGRSLYNIWYIYKVTTGRCVVIVLFLGITLLTLKSNILLHNLTIFNSITLVLQTCSELCPFLAFICEDKKFKRLNHHAEGSYMSSSDIPLWVPFFIFAHSWLSCERKLVFFFTSTVIWGTRSFNTSAILWKASVLACLL